MAIEKALTVKDVMNKWLAENKYDGLAQDGCGCRRGPGLMNCDCNPSDCLPGVEVDDGYGGTMIAEYKHDREVRP